MPEEDVAQNMRAVAHAVAQQELEGSIVLAATANDLRRGVVSEVSIGMHLPRRRTLPFQPIGATADPDGTLWVTEDEAIVMIVVP